MFTHVRRCLLYVPNGLCFTVSRFSFRTPVVYPCTSRLSHLSSDGVGARPRTHFGAETGKSQRRRLNCHIWMNPCHPIELAVARPSLSSTRTLIPPLCLTQPLHASSPSLSRPPGCWTHSSRSPWRVFHILCRHSEPSLPSTQVRQAQDSGSSHAPAPYPPVSNQHPLFVRYHVHTMPSFPTHVVRASEHQLCKCTLPRPLPSCRYESSSQFPCLNAMYRGISHVVSWMHPTLLRNACAFFSGIVRDCPVY